MSVQVSRAAKRYARALFDEARAQGVARDVRADMDALARVIAANPALARFLPNYLAPATSRANVLAGLFERRLRPLSWRMLRLLESRKRMGLLAEVAARYGAVHDEAEGLVDARIASAFPLDASLTGRIVRVVEGRTGMRVRATAVVDASLLAGVQVMFKDTLIDASAAGALRRLREQVAAAAGGRETGI